MELKKFEVEGKEVEFVNQYRNTRNGFAHDTTMFIDGRKVAEHTCHYLNRTWERYEFQTVMMCAVRDVEEQEIAYLKERFLKENQYKRLTESRKVEFEEYCNLHTAIRLYKEIKAKL